MQRQKLLENGEKPQHPYETRHDLCFPSLCVLSLERTE